MKRLRFISGFICGALIFSSISVFASDGIKTITASFNPSLKVTLDGEYWDLEKGAINYQNTNYISVRELAEKLGKQVDWNKETQTVEIISHIKSVEEGSDEMSVVNSEYVEWSLVAKFLSDQDENYHVVFEDGERIVKYKSKEIAIPRSVQYYDENLIPFVIIEFVEENFPEFFDQHYIKQTADTN